MGEEVGLKVGSLDGDKVGLMVGREVGFITVKSIVVDGFITDIPVGFEVGLIINNPDVGKEGLVVG